MAAVDEDTGLQEVCVSVISAGRPTIDVNVNITAEAAATNPAGIYMFEYYVNSIIMVIIINRT